MEDLNEAGGVYAVLSELNKKNLINTDCMTCTGKTVGENISGVVNKNPELIRPIDNPYHRQAESQFSEEILLLTPALLSVQPLHLKCLHMRVLQECLTARRTLSLLSEAAR